MGVCTEEDEGALANREEKVFFNGRGLEEAAAAAPPPSHVGVLHHHVLSRGQRDTYRHRKGSGIAPKELEDGPLAGQIRKIPAPIRK